MVTNPREGQLKRISMNSKNIFNSDIGEKFFSCVWEELNWDFINRVAVQVIEAEGGSSECKIYMYQWSPLGITYINLNI